MPADHTPLSIREPWASAIIKPVTRLGLPIWILPLRPLAIAIGCGIGWMFLGWLSPDGQTLALWIVGIGGGIGWTIWGWLNG